MTGWLPALTCRTYPGYESACNRSLTRELLRHCGDLVTVPRRRHPREPQGVGVVARDDVDVEVEDGLPGRSSARVQEVHAVRVEPLLRAPRELLGHPRARLEILGRDLEQVRAVLARDDEQMPLRGGGDVHEGDGALVLVHARGWDLARDDLAEQAIRVSHGRRVSARPSGRPPPTVCLSARPRLAFAVSGDLGRRSRPRGSPRASRGRPRSPP